MSKKNNIAIAIVIIAIAGAFFVWWSNRDMAVVPPEAVNIEMMTDKVGGTIALKEGNIATESYIDLNPTEASEFLKENPDTIIIDVSPHYDEGHLPGSVSYYLGDGSLDRGIPGLDKNKTYLVYCHVDNVAIAGAEKLIKAGFEKVYRLEGNYPGWEASGYPVEIFLEAKGPYDGSAKAVRGYNSNSKEFMHTLEADIADHPIGKFYEGWLVKKGSTTQFFSTGKLEKKDGKYLLEYLSDQDQREYNEVVVTEETEVSGLDGKPENHVFEGGF